MTSDEFDAWVGAWLHRQGKPDTKALRQWQYKDPASFVKFGKRGGGEVNRQSNQEIADTLLMEWHRWEKPWRPNLGVPKVSPSCRGYLQDERYADEESAYVETHRKEMKAVAFCVGAIEVSMQQAIGTEMRNREVKQKVWRDRSNKTFEQALFAVMPHMRKHEHLMALFN